ncbi:MAG: glycosyltransferase family 4 protein [Bacteroidota bacterium]|nr:glycosyltransferase family 4 protein [Bacteroidota bacterium]
MKKVLIITYYWPPSGGAGVQRWLKFAKYLPEYGIEPIIYTPSNPESPVNDDTLLNDIPKNLNIIKRRIFEPYSFYKVFTGKTQNQKVNAGFISEHKKTGLLEALSVWIRGNFFIPDARKYWVTPSVKFLSDYLQKNPVDTIITTGPPHSMHLIGMRLKKQLNITWIADFRDPWTEVDYYHLLKIGKRADKLHHKLEKKVVSSADVVLTVSESWAGDLKKIGAKKTKVITNGFDSTDFENLNNNIDNKFSIVHIGTIHKERNPHNLWKVLGELVSQNTEFRKKLKIRLIGKIDFSVIEEIEKNNLKSYVERISYLPHSEIPAQMKRSRVLLLLISRFVGSKGMIPGKLFEYIASERPIIMLGNTQGDTAKLINKHNVGQISEYENREEIKDTVLKCFNNYINKTDSKKAEGIERYNRQNLTKELANLIDPQS